ncbi:MAG: hypothetical protein H6857_04205 [Rhodospirillales bacterium]|nr:hypothetical protein [Rhodospirillales bacterium]MCB9973083.1 hypothetical protein [Rhodospirillales bacterium]
MTHAPAHPHRITIHKDDFFDTQRNRRVPVKLYIPDSPAEKLPCVFWSHGLGGGRDGASFLARYIAEHGFIVLHMTHLGTDTSLWEGKPGHPWDVIRSQRITRHVTMNRFKDPSFVLDELERRANAGEAPYTRIDFDQIGISGHSFGATTTQIMAGQKLGRGARLYSMRESRFTCGIAYSLGPTYNQTEDPEDIYGPISIPMLYMTGTEDSSPISGAPYTARLPIFEAAKGPDQHLLILKDGDHMVFAGSRGGLAENPKRTLHEQIIQRVSLAFWQAYLSQDSEAKDWLHSHSITDFLKDEAEWKLRNL